MKRDGKRIVWLALTSIRLIAGCGKAGERKLGTERN